MIRRTNKHQRRRSSPGLGNTPTPLPAVPTFTLLDATHLAVSFGTAIAVGVLSPSAFAGWSIRGASSGVQLVTSVAGNGNGVILELAPGSAGEVLTVTVPPRANPRSTLGGFTQSGVYTLGTAGAASVVFPSLNPNRLTFDFDGNLPIDLGVGGLSITGYQLVGAAPGDGSLHGSFQEADVDTGPWTLITGSELPQVVGSDQDFHVVVTTTKRLIRYSAHVEGDAPDFTISAFITVP